MIPALNAGVIMQIYRQIADFRQDGRKFALGIISEAVKRADGQKDKDIGENLAQQIREQS